MNAPAGDMTRAWDDLHPVLRRVYAARQVRSASDLDYSLHALCPPERMKGMAEAADLLAQAVTQDQDILLIGDFDTDGASAIAVMTRTLRRFGARSVDFLVPDRFRYEYGLSVELVDVAQQRGAQLLVTVDNGISSVQGVRHARGLGMRVLITDHHLPGDALPEADAIVNPNQPGDEFPSKHLAGVGVAFNVLIALRKRLAEQGWFERKGITDVRLDGMLDLVALGTVADMVKLDRNNRVLVAQGLRRIRQGQGCAGIRALLSVAKRDYRRARAADLGFSVAPRLNAAGRLTDMSSGIACLLCDEEDEALRLAKQLHELNRERREIQRKMEEDAYRMLEPDHIVVSGQAGLCVYDASWHHGVVGLVANRLRERYQRPAIAFAPDRDGMLKGSGRSVPGVHLRDVLADVAARCPDTLRRFGGHAMAVGLSVREDDLPRFEKLFADALEEQDQTVQAAGDDGELAEEELTVDVAEAVRDGGPWGNGFPEPLFRGNFLLRSARPFAGGKHVKLQLSKDETTITAVAFHYDGLEALSGVREVHIEYRLDVDEYAGVKTTRLIVENLEPC